MDDVVDDVDDVVDDADDVVDDVVVVDLPALGPTPSRS